MAIQASLDFGACSPATRSGLVGEHTNALGVGQQYTAVFTAALELNLPESRNTVPAMMSWT